MESLMVMAYGTHTDGSCSFHCPVAAMGTAAHFTFRVEASRAVCIMRQNGETQESSNLYGDKGGRSIVENVNLYVGDPWYQAADATITDFTFTP